MTTNRFCTFSVEGLLLGVDVSRVSEVVQVQQLTPVPLAHPSVLGLLNLRGHILPAVDARQRLQIGTADPSTDLVHIILKTRGELMSLVVDHEGQVLEIGDEQREDVPETISPVIRSFVEGAYQLEEGLLLVLNPDGVMSLSLV